MSVILTAVATLGAIGAGSAGILYLVSQKFKVEEDPASRRCRMPFPPLTAVAVAFPAVQPLLPPV